ncbi:hypothetical protein GCM10022403_022670 [Streptomyces coacervatus]|uniref:Uncharacterized protein n=1 Tax=Streptomyces coacervatus TaxID=647381 RepID=A0ABP7H9P8_9ACTN|nr:hypothetical protein [Streptomyces coacervatus]MDF2267734.1 hypothetical protein [Streptomyces coacervatus]
MPASPVSLASYVESWHPEPVTDTDALPPGPAAALSALLDLPEAARFLPPVPRRRRMFAGGRCTIGEPLRLGEPAERVSSLAAVAPKQGRSGELLFVTERQEFRQQGRICLVEVLDDSAVPEPEGPCRFSALTANAHRIHCDTPYC